MSASWFPVASRAALVSQDDCLKSYNCVTDTSETSFQDLNASVSFSDIYNADIIDIKDFSVSEALGDSTLLRREGNKDLRESNELFDEEISEFVANFKSHSSRSMQVNGYASFQYKSGSGFKDIKLSSEDLQRMKAAIRSSMPSSNKATKEIVAISKKAPDTNIQVVKGKPPSLTKIILYHVAILTLIFLVWKVIRFV